jgi:hypothetical protein
LTDQLPATAFTLSTVRISADPTTGATNNDYASTALLHRDRDLDSTVGVEPTLMFVPRGDNQR